MALIEIVGEGIGVGVAVADGEKISFSKTLIEKAIDSSLQLTDAQLDNINSLLLLVE